MQLTSPTSTDQATEVERCPLCHDALRSPTMHVLRCRSCETVHHQTCLREFAGCGTIGCERRASLSATKPKTKPKSKPKSKLRARRRSTPSGLAPAEGAKAGSGLGWLVGSLVLAWLSVPLFWVAGLLPSLVAAGVLATRGRKRKALLSVLLAPVIALPLVNALSATATYWTGTAELRFAGLPGPNFRTLDPVIRCSKSSSGCLVDGSEVLTQVPHNLALRGWGALCGPMPGAYDGPLPSLEEALNYVRQEGVVISQRDLRGLETGQLSVGDRRVEFDLEHLELPRHVSEVEETHLIQHSLWMAVYEERALIVVGPHHVHLIDLESNRLANRWWADVEPEHHAPLSARPR